jgi:UDP-glucose 4-epimerase
MTNSLKHKRILITGGAGMMGSHIAEQSIRRSVKEIVVLDNFVRGRRDNLASAEAAGTVRIVDGDILDRALLLELMSGIDVVFHAAAIRITQCAEVPRLALEVLVDGTYNVLDAAVQAHVSRLVFASSASVYGLADEFPTNEQHHPYNNRTFYGAAKAFAEGMLRSFNDMYGLNYVALRCFNVYGPHMDVYGVYTEVLIRWMERIANGLPPIILGDGTQSMDFVDVRDVARAQILAAESDVTDEVVNIATGVETSLHDLALTLLKVMGSDLKPEYGPERKVSPVSRRLADTSKARRVLGFEAEIDLEQGLRELVAWWKAERKPAKVICV